MTCRIKIQKSEAATGDDARALQDSLYALSVECPVKVSAPRPAFRAYALPALVGSILKDMNR